MLHYTVEKLQSLNLLKEILSADLRVPAINLEFIFERKYENPSVTAKDSPNPHYFHYQFLSIFYFHLVSR